MSTDELDRLREQRRAVSDVLKAMARSDGLQPVFDAVVEAAKRLCHADAAGLWLRAGNAYRVEAMVGVSAETLEWERQHPHSVDPDIPDRQTLTGRVLLTRALVHLPDVLADPEYQWRGESIAGYRAMLGVPIFADDDVSGLLGVTRTVPGPFAEELVDLVRTFADQAAIAIANARLLDAVERQRTELARFVSPQVAELISHETGRTLLAGHRAYISVLFCDLRGFTAFAETAAPEDLFDVLRDYHRLVGELIAAHQGTLEHFAGDGVMVFFNDPAPVEAHELQAVRMALELQEGFGELASVWRKRDTELGLGIGIAAGYATLGRIGFEGRYDYGAVGPVTNLASRLSTRAKGGQTLISQRVLAAVEDAVDIEPVGELELKGFARPVAAHAVRGLRSA